MELLKLLSTNEIVAQVISFLLLFFLLRKFAWKSILGLLDSRKEKIASEFKKIEEAKLQLDIIKADYEEKLASIKAAAEKIILEAAAEGRQVTDEIRKKAHLEAQEIINNARQNIQSELAKAKEELKEKVVDLTIKATENIIREKLTGDDDRLLINDFLEKLDEA
ncbi:MAG: F0F1 ATP synthase subunit B [Candidatus Omnitrophica bacterium]|nr:F0F1 ATP synthase subunit B [Candidatus Omnitrophota bacterium]